MVYVPSGSFTMGMDKPQADKIAKELGYRDYNQIAAYEWFLQRQEWTDGYFIDAYEVTKPRWRRFVKESDFKSINKAAKRFGLHPDETYFYIGFRTIWQPPAGYFQSDAFVQVKTAVAAQEKKIDALRAAGAPKPPRF